MASAYSLTEYKSETLNLELEQTVATLIGIGAALSTKFGRIEPEEEAGFFALPAWQRQVLDERLADLERHPEDEQTWEEVKAEFCPTHKAGALPRSEA